MTLLKTLIQKTDSPKIFDAPEEFEFLIGTAGVGYAKIKQSSDKGLFEEAPLSGVTRDGWAKTGGKYSSPLNVATSLSYFYNYLKYKYEQPILDVSPYGHLPNHPLNLFIKNNSSIVNILPEVITDYVEYNKWSILTVDKTYKAYIPVEDTSRKDIMDIE